jgi:hypothetical protein
MRLRSSPRRLYRLKKRSAEIKIEQMADASKYAGKI